MSPISSLWFKWKSLRLPWRKSFLVGQDLRGNTFWEFKDALNAGRFRRIVKFDPKTHFADVQVTPQWHQWLRHVRREPPSIQEQQQDVLRQMQIKQLARLADERWASKPSYLDKPATNATPAPATANPADAVTAPAATPAAPASTPDAPAAQESLPQQQTNPAAGTETKPKTDDTTTTTKKDKDPWAAAGKGGPSEKWEPAPWTPSAARR
ncbi:uncharacterized protein BDW47DRAFT_5778 [Aspergillus candidus]|uniref:Uncharacterized protein n=1 Tax=Aspergillus candidus TaxID=41067 RepID=A0A2I2FHH1_ASPCN|nr:hypothetical protein BDW47DRAFT_5778 [Aspergillus candidus]PLB40087.1 hypothetical protein BDW47DRAFT_5778 [Aspergillus candidus]